MSSFLQILSSPIAEMISWAIIGGFAVSGAWMLIRLRQKLKVYNGLVIRLPDLQTHEAMCEVAEGTYLAEFGKNYPLGGLKRPNRDLFMLELDHELTQQDGMIRFIIGGFTILGLILTFIGMLGTLSHATGIIEGLSRATEIKAAFETLIHELGVVMNGMISAFGRTVAALFLSLFMGLLFNQLQKSRSAIFKELVAFHDNVLRSWYFGSNDENASVPEKLGHLEESLVKELRVVGGRVGKLITSFADVREGLDSVSTTTQASSNTLVNALASRTEEEGRFQQKYLEAADRMAETLGGLTKIVADHTAISNELGILLASLNPQKRHLTPFEDLKTLFAGVHAMVERLAQLQEAAFQYQQQSQQTSIGHFGEQTRYLSHVVQRLEAPSRIEPTLVELGNTLEQQRLLLQSIGHLLAQQEQRPTNETRLDKIHGLEPLLREQTRLLAMMAEQSVRPWWERVGVGRRRPSSGLQPQYPPFAGTEEPTNLEAIADRSTNV